MVYKSLTNISAAVLPDLFVYANDVTQGIAGILFLSGIILVMIIGLQFYVSPPKALAASSIVGALIAVPLYYSGVIIAEILWGTAILAVLMIIWAYYSKEDV